MSFILVQVIVGGLLLGAVYALFSSGLTLVWGMMNIVNFAHGDFVMLGMYVAFVVFTLFGAGPLAGAPLATLLLATLGVVVYFGLIRDIMKGPMLAQILGTFGLALLLRYSVFWWFGANFLSLPQNIVGGTFAVFGLRIEASRLLAGVVALLVTLGLHLLLTRTSLGSKMLAVAEDSTAAQLMGIRPDTMQAIAWAIAAGATGLAGALIATFFYIVPTVGETLGIVAFVTVSLGVRQRARRFGRGASHRRHRVAVGISHRRGLQGYRGLCAVPVLPLVQAARPDGQDLVSKIW
jgi:branched-chain amino acid transport system permease protein